MHAAVLFVLLSTPGQLHPANHADPEQCIAVLEDLGSVGFRISDAQALASDVIDGLRARVGQDRVVFEGTYAGQLKLKKMVGPSGENSIQDEQLAYYKAAMEHASYKVRVRFGHKGKKTHWIELSCRKASADPKDVLDSNRFEAASFADARKQLKEAMPTFCQIMDPPAARTTLPGAAKPGDASGPLPPRKNKPRDGWTLPPRRD